MLQKKWQKVIRCHYYAVDDFDICVYGAWYAQHDNHRMVKLRKFQMEHFYDGAPDSPYYVAEETLILHSMYAVRMALNGK